MPVIKNWNEAPMPEWSKIKKYELLTVFPGDSIKLDQSYPKVALYAVRGRFFVEDHGNTTEMDTHQFYMTDNPEITISYKKRYFLEKNQILVVHGDWEKAEISYFPVERCERPVNNGTELVNYRNTCFDNHYHDFDEYWIVIEGSGVVYSDGEFTEVKTGDCVATRVGVNHDFPIVHEFVGAVAFETEKVGRKRQGHLWEHRDGLAIPME